MAEDSSISGIRELRNKLISVALASSEFLQALREASKEIKSEAKSVANEATIEGIFERVVYAILREIGIRFHPEKEAWVCFLL